MTNRENCKTHQKIIAQRIRELLASRDMTQTQLAKKSGVARSCICLFVNENRYPTLTPLMKIAEALSVSVSYLVGDGDTSDVAEVISNSKPLKKFLTTFLSLPAQVQDVLMRQVEAMKK